MSNFACRCGNVMRSVTDVQEHDKFLFTSETTTDLIIKDESNSFNVDVFVKALLEEAKPVIHCPECDRIWIKLDHDSPEFTSYMREKIS